MMKELYKTALMNCKVKDSKIVFDKKYTAEEISLIYNRLATAMLDYDIPHYRVIGIRATDMYSTSVIKVNPSLGCSSVELSIKLKDIIPTKLGGDRFTGSEGDDEEFRVLTRNGMKLGQLVFNPKNFRVDDPTNFCTDNLFFYSKEGWLEPVGKDKPEFLLDNQKIIDYVETDMGDSSIVILYYRDRGTRDYGDNSVLFEDTSNIFPCRTEYDLHKFFTIRYPDYVDASCMDLHYFKTIDEAGLETILREYAEEL